jgi:hypothetical protein
MSTKIYNGLKLPNMSVFELNKMYKNLRSKLIPVVQQEYYKFVAKIYQSAYVYVKLDVNICEYNIDMKNLPHEADDDEILLFAKREACDIINKTRNAILWADAEPDADFEVSLSILPIQDVILCIPSANNHVLSDELKLLLMDCFHAEEYGYWDNTDRPGELTKDEWNKRKDDWNKALPDALGVPRQNGFVIRLLDSEFDLTKQAGAAPKFITPYVESDEVLCKRAAKQQLIMEKYAEYIHDFESAGNVSAYKAWRLATEYIQKNPEDIEKLTTKFMEKLRNGES